MYVCSYNIGKYCSDLTWNYNLIRIQRKKNCTENIIYQLKNTNIAQLEIRTFFFYIYKAKVDIFLSALLRRMFVKTYDRVHMIKHLGRLRRRSSDISFGWFRIILTTCNSKNIQNIF